MRAFRWCVALLAGALVLLAGSVWAQSTDLMPGMDARGTDHTAHDHSGQTLDGVDLSPDPATGSHSLLDMAIFDDADLSFADLSRVSATNLSGLNLVLDGAELSGGDWSDSTLDAADLRFATGTAPVFDGASLVGAGFDSINLLSASFVGADLTGLLGANAQLVGIDLTDATLPGAMLGSASLRDGRVVGADLAGANLALADLTRLDARCGDSIADPVVDPPDVATCPRLEGAQLQFAILSDGLFQYGRLVDSGGTPVDLRATDLLRVDFSDACFTTLDMAGACDPTPQAQPANLSNALVDGARFDRAVMTGVDLAFARGGCVPARPGDPDQSQRCPSLVEVDLSGADMRQVRILSSVATEAKLHGADLRNAVLSGIEEPCRLPSVADTPGPCLELFDPTVMSPQLALVTGLDLTDADIGGIDFAGLDLTGANLTSVDAFVVRTGADAGEQPVTADYAASFAGAILVDAVLGSADLEQVDLTGADLTRANLSGALLTSAMLAGANATDASFDRVVLGCGTPPCTTFQGLGGLTGASFVVTDLTGQDLSTIDLTGADFAQAVLTDVVLTGATLANANFTAQVLTNVDLTDVSALAGARFDQANLTCSPATPCDPFPPAVDLSGASFAGATLNEVSFAGRDVTGADFAQANLTNAALTGADATGADFSNATLTGVDFTDETLDAAIFDGTSLGCADPVGCEPFASAASLGVEPSFGGADLTNATFDGLSGTIDLAGADFSSADLTNATFSNVDARGARFDFLSAVCSAAGDCADFSGATLSDGLVGASFVRAELGRVSFSGQDLRVVDMSGAQLAEAIFSGADLTGVDLADAVLDDVDFTNAALDDVDLANADLNDADLTSATLLRARLDDTSFAGATFARNGTTQPILGGTGCTPAAGEIPVDLIGASLVGADFGSALNFYEGCIVVDETTTYDSATTVFPPNFTLASQMTNVPEPRAGLGQAVALATLVVLARARRRRRRG